MRSPESPPRAAPTSLPARLLPLTLALLLTACAAPLPVPASLSVPPLPQEARQPPTPEWCRPTCSTWLRDWLNSQTSAVQPGQSASSPSMR